MPLSSAATLPLLLRVNLQGDSPAEVANAADALAQAILDGTEYEAEEARWCVSHLLLSSSVSSRQARIMALDLYSVTSTPDEGGVASVVMAAQTRPDLARGLASLSAELRRTGELDVSEKGEPEAWYSFLAEYSELDPEDSEEEDGEEECRASAGA